MKFNVCEKYVQLNRLKVVCVDTKDCKKFYDENGFLNSILLKKIPTMEMMINGKADKKSLSNYDAIALIKNNLIIIFLALNGGELYSDEEIKDQLKFYIKPNFLIHVDIMNGWYNDLEKISKIESEFERSLFAK
ncbi:TPA: hypothetical protein ACIEC1_002644 [Enterococcus faecium]